MWEMEGAGAAARGAGIYDMMTIPEEHEDVHDDADSSDDEDRFCCEEDESDDDNDDDSIVRILSQGRASNALDSLDSASAQRAEASGATCEQRGQQASSGARSPADRIVRVLAGRGSSNPLAAASTQRVGKLLTRLLSRARRALSNTSRGRQGIHATRCNTY